jgi:hypothetical protein
MGATDTLIPTPTHPERGAIIDAFQRLLEDQSTADAATRTITAICELSIRSSPGDRRNGVIWYILCDAMRSLGGSNEINTRLIGLMSAIRTIEVMDKYGHVIKYGGVRSYWTGLPMLALTFPEYGIGR